MTIKSLYPTVRPTLNLDFAKTKALDPRVTFSRASTGTFVGSNGLIQTAASGAARFDQNYATGESLGLLVEEARTNQILDSGTIVRGGTITDALTITTSSTTAPNGVLASADLITPTTSNTYHQTYSAYNYTGTTVTLSVFVKPNGYSKVAINAGPTGLTYFDLSGNGSLLYKDNTAIGHSVEKLSNGWFRISTTNASSPGSYRYQILVLDPAYTTGFPGPFAGDGTSGMYVWGLQLETGSFPTSYIPTVASTVTRAADVATLANTGSSIFPTSAFTTVNSPFGTAGGGTSFKLVGPTIKRTAVYAGDLPQAQINALAGVNDGFWRWRVLGGTFALPSFTTNGSVTVDWGDGAVETLTTAVHTFTNGGGYHDIGFRLNSGTFFKPNINGNATYGPRVIAVGPAPASMKVDASAGFYGCSALRLLDATLDPTGSTDLQLAWLNCTNLASFPLINTAAVTNFFGAWQSCTSLALFPLINTAAVTNFRQAWNGCSGLTSFPLINTAAGTNFQEAWAGCSSLTSFPLINTGAGTNFYSAWNGCSGLTSFPLINTAAGTNFREAWRYCSALTSFPLINTAAGTNFWGAWENCSNLTSFPLINTAAGTDFFIAWLNCTNLTSFPLINTAAGTNFLGAWQGCTSLTSFPLINTAAGTNFQQAWNNCTNLATFPANVFNTTGTLVAGAFASAFNGCALTATSIENILTSLVTNGQSNITLTLSGGTNANTSTWSAAAKYAYLTLIARGWTITQNGTAPTDADADAYIAAVEAADGASLETGVKTAITTFVLGCKVDGTWSAIKASCILAGARTLSGALVSLSGTAPTNNNFVSGDYDRKTGLVGDGSSKYLDSNRNNNVDPQDSKHISVYATTKGFGGGRNNGYIGYSDTSIFSSGSSSTLVFAGINGGTVFDPINIAPGLIGANRNASNSLQCRGGGTTLSSATASTTPTSGNIALFRYNYSNARLAFYSIGESLDLALLDARVTTLIAAYAAAIP